MEKLKQQQKSKRKKKEMLFTLLIGFLFFLLPFSACEKDEHIQCGIPGSGVTDIEGNEYKTFWIAGMEWMTENLRTTRYINDEEIPTGLGSFEWQNATSGAYSIYPHSGIDGLTSDDEVMDAYGILYNWYAVDDSRGLCPEGWRVASDDDWTKLVDFLMDEYNLTNESDDDNGVGNNLKAARQVDHPWGNEHNISEHPRWNSHNTHFGTDNFHFSAFPGGTRSANGSFYYLGSLGHWWSSTKSSPSYAWIRSMNSGSGHVARSSPNKAWGFSVRCVRNE